MQDSPFAPLELNNLADDPLESKNLAGSQQPIVEQLNVALRDRLQRGGVVPWQAEEG